MTDAILHYQTTSFVERTALHARRLLHAPELTPSMMEDVRSCILTIEDVRARVPDRNPGFHEAALQRLVTFLTDEEE